ncbi:NADPH oxidase activator 1-like [Lampris incognitus]|uniref:NADPH oxidase activator 1-like n=1 Tax=Lampris incognitus TaxID=2546036 RepID=UPI0024B527A1|nr:NADPH oxidase activator 1-like [Lampris incognitus]
MLYTELLRLWDEAVKAVDAKDWHTALEKLDQITEPTSRTLFLTASVNLALKQLEPALQALDQVIVKDERLAVGFFQRAGILMQLGRLEDSLSDYIWAQKHMRRNMMIDYKQLGLRYKLHSWQVMYNAAAVYSRMDQWDQAMDILLTAAQERPGGLGGNLELAIDSVARGDVLTPLMVPEGEVFRPRKQDVEQLQQRDFLGKAKVISSMIPNDDFGGFEPLRTQKPGFYEPKTDGLADSHYMRMRVPYMARGPGQLTVPGGAMVFIFKEVDRDGMVTVIYDGQRGLLPVSLLEPTNVKTSKGKNEKSVPSGIPLPPGLKPPTRPQTTSRPPPPQAHLATTTLPPSNTAVILPPLQATELPRYTSDVSSPTDQYDGSAEGDKADSVIVKVHYVYTLALTVPSDTPYHELQERIANKLGQPAACLRLRHKQHGSQVLKPLEENGETGTLLDVAEAGRATLWCQTEAPLANRTILYQMVALYDYAAEGPEDLVFSEGDTVDILSEVNEEWLEGHCAGNIGIFPRCFAYREISRDDTSTIL